MTKINQAKSCHSLDDLTCHFTCKTYKCCFLTLKSCLLTKRAFSDFHSCVPHAAVLILFPQKWWTRLWWSKCTETQQTKQQHTKTTNPICMWCFNTWFRVIVGNKSFEMKRRKGKRKTSNICLLPFSTHSMCDPRLYKTWYRCFTRSSRIMLLIFL